MGVKLLYLFCEYLTATLFIAITEYKLKGQKEQNWPEPTLVDEEPSDSADLVFPVEAPKPAEKHSFVDPNEKKLLKSNDSSKPIDYFVTPSDIGSIYLLNPLSILACVAFSTQVFDNVFILSALYFAIKGKSGLCAFSIAVASYLSFYPIVMLVPCVLILSREKMVNVFSCNVEFCYGFACFVFYRPKFWPFNLFFFFTNGQFQLFACYIWDNVLNFNVDFGFMI